MYNRYIDPGGWDSQFSPAGPDPQPEEASRHSGLLDLLGGRFKMPELNSDTLLLVLLVYFLVADRDEEEPQTKDTLFIIGALLLLGL